MTGTDGFVAPLKVLDLFCGLKGWSKPFADRGHDVRTLDFDPKFNATYTADILAWVPERMGDWRPDVVLASPPCEGFTVMNIGKNWNHDHTPKTAKAELALAIMRRTVDLIQELNPKWFWIENPRGKMRRLMEIHAPLWKRVQVTYCHYGRETMKPTDLWGQWPATWKPEPACRNGDPCHIATPRGTTTHGTQAAGRTPESRAEIPEPLSRSVMDACEASGSLPVLLEKRPRVAAPVGGWF